MGDGIPDAKVLWAQGWKNADLGLLTRNFLRQRCPHSNMGVRERTARVPLLWILG